MTQSPQISATAIPVNAIQQIIVFVLSRPAFESMLFDRVIQMDSAYSATRPAAIKSICSAARRAILGDRRGDIVRTGVRREAAVTSSA
jgi:hypothetical protein